MVQSFNPLFGTTACFDLFSEGEIRLIETRTSFNMPTIYECTSFRLLHVFPIAFRPLGWTPLPFRALAQPSRAPTTGREKIGVKFCTCTPSVELKKNPRALI
ncbi:hypothetical protein CDAR_621371 [Caerostris darwini]|uniref:Uncharacterized protein n=1 Tax=Caerostris darwini TaxID=1538125 RepID=A0AAV4S8H0_9ARAC|nr:hypothetical protein CDAR_621371 [Caerostris darwini]